MIEGLDDSVTAYNDRIVGEKTKQKNAQLRFAQKTLRLTKTIRIAAFIFVIRLTYCYYYNKKKVLSWRIRGYYD